MIGGKWIVDPWEFKTSVYWKIKSVQKRVVVVQGGGQAGKTIGIEQVLGDIAIDEPGSIISVFGMTYDHLDRGALRDFKDLIYNNPAFRILLTNPDAKEGPFILKNRSLIEFIALDKPIKALGAKRTHAFFNEANAISYETYERIALRTSKRIFIDYNPTARFWVHDRVLPFKDTAQGFTVTFMDNEFCPPEAAATLKGYFLKWKETGSPYWENLWRVYGLGKTGIVEGVVFPKINILSKFPDKSELKNFGYAIDWGFTHDPTTLTKCGILKNGQFVGQELIYQTGIHASSFDELLPKYGITKSDPIIADSANMDGIVLLQKKGWNILPADKPPGSVKQGIELLNSSGINLVQGSENWIREQGEYVYKTKLGIIDKDDPVDKSNHCWDGARYFARYAILGLGVNNKKRTQRPTKSYAY